MEPASPKFDSVSRVTARRRRNEGGSSQIILLSKIGTIDVVPSLATEYPAIPHCCSDPFPGRDNPLITHPQHVSELVKPHG